MRSSPAATRRRRPEGTAVSRFEDVLWAVRAARSSRTAVPCPPAAAKYRQLLMHAVCASAGSSSHCMIAPHQRLQVRSRWLFRPGQRSSGCGVLQKRGRRRVFGHTQAPVSPEPRGDVHESEGLSGLEVRLCTAGHTRAQRRTAPRHCGAEVGSPVCGLGVSFAAARTEQQQEEEDEAGERRRRGQAARGEERGGMPLSCRPSAVRSVTDCDHSHGSHVTLAICLPADAYRQPPRMKALDRMMQYVSGRRTSVWLQLVRLRNTHSNTTLPVQQAI